jgi:phosphate starvation-inducible protein PhoH and related proteins
MRGRAQPVDTPVLTPDGFRPIGSLRIGDLVIGSAGRPTPVIGVYPQGRKQVFRVRAQDGGATLACGEHLWFVTTRGDRRRGRAGRVLTTEELRTSLRRRPRRRYQLPLVGAVEFEPRQVPIDPYELGLLLGDGRPCLRATPSFATPSFATPTFATTAAGGRGGLRTADPVALAVRELGLAEATPATTFVPSSYLRNSSDVRLAVLQGLLDTGGGAVRRGRVRFAACSPQLRDDVVFLVRSLGGLAQRRTPRPIRHRDDAHVVDLRLPSGVMPFRLSRKRAGYPQDGGGRPRRFVDGIEPAGERDCVCIAVAAEDSLYVTADFLVTHNTLNDAFIILDEAQNTSAEQMKMFLTRLGFGAKMVVTGDVTQVDLPAGTQSGLRVVQQILTGVGDVAFHTLTSADVVRHRLVSDIVDAYAIWDQQQHAAAPPYRRQNRGRS